MSKLLCGSVLWLTFGSLSAWAQGAPALDTFTSPDGAFQFVYPETYQLLVGESMLKATQSRQPGVSVCNFSTALACVIYPIEVQEDTRFEAAGFSVEAVPGVSIESDCLTYTDQVARSRGEQFQITSIAINEQVFRHASARKKMLGHVQAVDLYRTFIRQTCYELQINVSVTDDSKVQRAAQSGLLGDPRANTAREALRLILSSIVFQ